MTSILNQLKDAIKDHSPKELSELTGIPRRSVQSIIDGNVPSIEKVEKIFAALGTKLQTSPSSEESENAKAVPAKSHKKATVSHLGGPSMLPIKDRELAEILTIIADEWDALNAHGRKQLLARFQAAFPELRGGAPLSRIVGFLGWKVIDTASARGAKK